MKNPKVILFVLVVAMACEERAGLFSSLPDNPVLIVEAVLTNEIKSHQIKLSHPHAIQNSAPVPASSATVEINVGDIIYPALESPPGSGRYHTDEFAAVFGEVYTLTIRYRGNTFIARDASVPVEPMPLINYTKTDQPFFYELVEEENGADPSYTTYDFDWENTTFCETSGSCSGRVVFYDLKTADVQELFKPDKTEFYFPVDATVIRRKYSISENYRYYLRGILSESEWRGGYFDVDKANAVTNLSEGATGFFAVTTVITDTTKIVAIP